MIVSFDAHSGHNVESIFMKPTLLVVINGVKSLDLALLYILRMQFLIDLIKELGDTSCGRWSDEKSVFAS